MKKNKFYGQFASEQSSVKTRRRKAKFPIRLIVTAGSALIAFVAIVGVSDLLSKSKTNQKDPFQMDGDPNILLSNSSSQGIDTSSDVLSENFETDNHEVIPASSNFSSEPTEITEVEMTDILAAEETITSETTGFKSSSGNTQNIPAPSVVNYAPPPESSPSVSSETQPSVSSAAPSLSETKAPSQESSVIQETSVTSTPATNTKPAGSAPVSTDPAPQDTSPSETVPSETNPPAESSKPAKPSETPVWGTLYASTQINVRTGPGTEYEIVKELSVGDGVDVAALTDNGWYRSVKDTYVSAEYLVETRPVAPSPAPTPTPPSENVTVAPENNGPEVTIPEDTKPSSPASPAPVDPSSSDLATFARSFIGTPYTFAGGSPSAGFDCSGFVKYIFANYYGITLTHQSNAILKSGVAVDAKDIQVGDVVCYDYTRSGGSDHVGVYIGNGLVVHASNNRQKVIESSFTMDSVVSIRRITG